MSERIKLDAAIQRNTNSKARLAVRQDVMTKSRGATFTASLGINHPTVIKPANRNFARKVRSEEKWLKDYSDAFRIPPNIFNVKDKKLSTGAYSTNNRFTGALDVNTPGLNGTYWGTPMGVAAEDAFYSMFEHHDGSGPPRLMQKYGHLTVTRVKNALNYWAEEETPKQVLFSGSNDVNILIARTIRPIRCLNLNLDDPEVLDHLHKIQPKFQQILDALEFSDIPQALEDPYFREFARQFAAGACESRDVEAIWARSARVNEGAGLRDFNRDEAHNLILLGQANQSVSDRLLGISVVKIRSSEEGLTAMATPIYGPQSPYYTGQPKDLVVTPKNAE